VAVDLAKLRNLADAARAKAQKSTQRREGNKSWYRIENSTTDGAEIYLYDMIGEWGITAQDFVGDLKTINSQSIDLHMNCEGGEVFDGLAIYESLRQHPANVTAYIDGIAASAASFIAMAADKIVMAERARMMIHDAHGLCMGNAADMKDMAALLDDLSANIADIYAERAGGTSAKWRKAMQANVDGTWYSAQEAVKAGLADEIAGKPAKETNQAAVAWDPKEFLNLFKESAA
jgi:ATP-dependent protease ClpP protease subunit